MGRKAHVLSKHQVEYGTSLPLEYFEKVRVVDPTDDSPLVEMNKITETTLNQILSELKEGGLMICERP